MAKKVTTRKSEREWAFVPSASKKEHWSMTFIPDGDIHAPYVKRMSKNSDGTWTFYVFRNEKCIGAIRNKDIAAALVECSQRAELGKIPQKVLDDDKAFMNYINSGERSAEQFKKLSKGMQAAVLATYPWAMPKKSEMEAKGITVKPTVERTDLMGKHEKAAAKAGKYELDHKIKRVKEGNAKKPGSKQHQRWETVFAFAGKTVRECLNGGGDKYGIEGTLEAGYIKLVP